MAGLGIQELAIILVVVLVIFGAGRLPDMMKQLGSGIREVKHVSAELEETERSLREP